MNESEVARITTALNVMHSELIHCQEEQLTSVELAQYRLATSFYDRGYVLEDIGEAGMLPRAEAKCIVLNRISLDMIFGCLAKATCEDHEFAAALFALHEAFHIKQGLPHHTDVRNVKRIGGQWLISFLDLRSTSYAANLLADLLALRTVPPKVESTRKEIFQRLWIDIGHASLRAFPVYNNPTKCQRFVGHLMTSALILSPDIWPTWPFSTRRILWPIWSTNEDELMVLSDDIELLIAPTKVPRMKLRRAVELLCMGDITEALGPICELLRLLQPLEQRHGKYDRRC